MGTHAYIPANVGVPSLIRKKMEDDKRVDDNGILGDSGGTGETSGSDSGVNFSDEIDNQYSTGKENVDESNSGQDNRGDGKEQELQSRAISTLPGGCNVFYGTYIDNYNGGTRRRYYFDSYGQLILTHTTSRVDKPSGVSCLTEMPMSHNMDMGIVVAEAAAAIAIYLAVKFVVGRLIK